MPTITVLIRHVDHNDLQNKFSKLVTYVPQRDGQLQDFFFVSVEKEKSINN
jgi:hypothetical protein